MAYLTQPDYVKYVCSCGQLKPITSLYFCRHCLKIRCGFCICHEVDSHYCANCLENMPSSEARLKKNRCSSCFDCPSCFHTLSTRATLAQPRQAAPQDAGAGGDTKVENKQPKKMYYLSCFNCRWTSRDVGIPDQPVASGGWPERSNPFAARVSQLLDYYKLVAAQEKQDKIEKERKKFNIRGKYITLTDKTGLTGAMARNIAGLPSIESSEMRRFQPSEASADVEQLPDDVYTKDVTLTQITSMPQRLASPEWQPSSVSRLHPLARLLSVKRSQRCRHCDHNLTKPEYNPGSIKFKIELLAYYHVPEIKIISFEPLKPDGKSALVIKLTNPTGHEMQVSLSGQEETEVEESRDTEEGEKTEESIDKSLEKSLHLDQEPPAASHAVSPRVSLSLPQRDDAAEYDEDTTHDNNDVIVWRKSNKVCLRLSLSPAAPAAPPSAALRLQYSYRNTVPHDTHTTHTLNATVVLDLAQVSN